MKELICKLTEFPDHPLDHYEPIITVIILFKEREKRESNDYS